MRLHILNLAAVGVFTLVSLSHPVLAAPLDDYYLQQFGETTTSASGPPKAVSETADSLVARCGMPLKHDLRRDWDKLEPSTQTVLAKQLAAPVLSGEVIFPSDSGYFRIHYASTTGAVDTPVPPDGYTLESWIQQVADSFDLAYSEYLKRSYRPPPIAPYHIYLRSLAALKIYGQTTTLAPVPSAGFPYAYSSYIEIDKDFTDVIFTKNPVLYTPLDSLQITSAHEFHHAIQFGYNVFFDVWYAETTSTWYEGEIYPLIRQLYDYVPAWFANSTRRLDLAVDANAVSTGAGYGRWIFNRYLTELHTTGIVRTTWEALAPLNSPDGINDIPMLPVINTVLGGSLPTDVIGFAGRIYRKQEWPLAFDRTTTRLLYVPVSIYSGYPVNNLSIPKPEVFLEQYSFAFYRFPIPTTTDMSILVNGTPAIAARAFRKDSAGTVTELSFPTTYPSSVSILSANTAAEIVLLLVNTSGNTTQNANFSTDGSFQTTSPVTATVDPTPPASSTSSSSGGGGSCFIATAAYGSYLHPQVRILRNFRDTRLLTNTPGRFFVAQYYRFSPTVAGVIAQHAPLRLLTRLLLTPILLTIAHPAPAGFIALTALCSVAVLVRRIKTTYDVHQDPAV